MKETQASIYQWAVETFGEAKSELHIYGRAKDEFQELEMALIDGVQLPDYTFRNPERIVEEIADVVIVLSQIAERLGLDLGEAIDRKMAINREREWRTNGDGTGQHVEEFPGSVVAPDAGIFACSPEDAGRAL